MVIQGFSSYEIFPDGSVYSRISDKFLSCNIKNTDRYKNLVLKSDSGKQVNVHIHVLVARHFLPTGYFEGAFVNHKDGNKHNNHKDNLEWVTRSENELHAHRIGLKTGRSQVKCFCGKTLYDNIDALALGENITKGCAWYRVKKGNTVDGKTYGLQ